MDFDSANQLVPMFIQCTGWSLLTAELEQFSQLYLTITNCRFFSSLYVKSTRIRVGHEISRALSVLGNRGPFIILMIMILL